jgi:pimeloyl-ACP methyl ester carboxylesterase
MKKNLKIVKWITGVSILIFLLAFISLIAYRFYLKHSTKIETQNGISCLKEITLGNMKQWIFIRGEDINNPVLIFLHGGFGMSMGGISVSRKFDSDLIKNFTIVHWDQRGAGKSYNSDIPVSSMNFDRLVEDCNELIDYIRERFSAEKIFLVAHSTGTVIGIKTAYKYPEKLYAYVGVGQIINDLEQQRIRYEFILEKSEKSKDIKIHDKIKAIGPPPYTIPQNFIDIENYILKFGGTIHNDVIKQIGILMFSFLTSPEYSLSEGFKTLSMEGMQFTMNSMWEEAMSINLTKEIQSIQIPVYFFEGKFDMNVPSVYVQNFYNSLDIDKEKNLIIFENSAHFPMIEEKERYEELLVNMVLKENYILLK